MAGQKKYAIITPYYQEERPLLERCLRSVRAQTVRTDHILVADGHPQSWLDGEGVRHIRLDRAHGDYGNTPRAIGALLAIAEEYDGLGFLDADNWLDADHVQKCLTAAAAEFDDPLYCDYVIAQRRFRRPDESVMELPEELNHVDTNCFFFLRGSFGVVPIWGTMPRAVTQMSDSVFYAMIQRRPLKAARVSSKTVNYHNLWEVYYRGIGETPPPGAKPKVDNETIRKWQAGLSPREEEIKNRLCGFPLRVRLKSELAS